MEKQISTTRIYDGRIVNLRNDVVECDGGIIAEREIIEHVGGASIAMEDEDGKYLLVSQYRYAQQMEMLEYPAGKLEPGEDPLETVKREVQEETGYEALDVEYLGFCVPTGAYLQERIYMYMGRCGKFVGTDFDRDENLALQRYTLEELTEMIMNNEIVDAKTIAMTFKVLQKKNGK